MFQTEGLLDLARTHRATLKELNELGGELAGRFPGLEAAVEALVLAVASGEALLLVGPPGTAKSRLIRAFCHTVGLVGDDDLKDPAARRTTDDKQVAPAGADYFEYLLTPFTEPAELFGFFDLAALQGPAPRLERLEAGMMQTARVVFLDEVFNASSAILNSLLAFMNERKFHDRGKATPVRLECLFAASNQVPTSPELRAMFDRFLLRCWVENAPSERASLAGLLDAGWRETHAPPVSTACKAHPKLLEKGREMRESIEEMSAAGRLAINREDRFFAHLADLTRTVRQRQYSDLSNRRLVRFAKIMLMSALLRWERGGDQRPPALTTDDLLKVVRFGLDQPPSRDFVAKLEASAA